MGDGLLARKRYLYFVFSIKKMNGIVDVYEHYFNSLISFQFDFNKRKQHSCLACTKDFITEGHFEILSREKTEQFIINYLEHLKIFGYSVKSVEIFIQSIRNNGILSSKVKGDWKVKKHAMHDIIVIEHYIYDDNVLLKEM